MKMMALTLALFGTTSAVAGSFDCTTSDGALVYNYSFSNGGAQRPPTEKLVLNGETLIDKSFPGGATIQLASFQVESEVSSEAPVIAGNMKTTKSINQVKVVLKSTNATAFEGNASCTHAVYIGPPIP